MATRLEKHRKIPPGESLAVAENALITAVAKHDPARGALSTLFFWAVESEVQRWFQYNRPLGYRTRFDGSIPGDAPAVFGSDASILAATLDGREPVVTPEERADLPAVFEAIGKLDRKHREAILGHAMRGEPYHDIAARIGVSKERVRQLCNAAIRRVRRSLKIDTEALAC